MSTARQGIQSQWLSKFVLLPLFVLNLIVVPASAQLFQIITTEGRSTTVTAAQLATAHRTTITAQDHDSPATFEGVLLWELLSSAGVALGDKLRGPRMTEVVIIEAADGYKVAFALAELDSAFTSSKAILADKRDGKPLSAKEGPFRIVVPSDKRPARWVRQVTALRVVVAN